MKKSVNFAGWTARLFSAVVMVMVMVGFASCDKDFNTNSSQSLDTRFEANTDGLKGWESFINDSTKRDSVRLPDGTFDRVLLKVKVTALPHREVIVENFDNPNAGESFSSDRRLIDSRREGNWKIDSYSTNPYKGVEVGSTGETVRYTTYEEVATYLGENGTLEFTSEGFEVENVLDNFSGAQLSSKDGYTELDYKNSIKATYTGYNTSKVFNKEETIAFFAKGDVPVPDPEKPTYTTTWDIKYTTTYVTPSWEKIQVNPDGSRETVEKDAANLPISVTPETNWTINVDNLGTYVSNAFAKTLISKTPKKSGNFSYNEYTYRVYNTVAGQTNSLLVKVPGDIVREKDDERQEYQTTELIVNKGAESTTFKSEDDSKKVYSYSVVANVIFGASQSVNLPGTINLKKAEPETNHEHGKVREVLFTSTPNENRSFYKNVAVIVFEDGYRSIGMAENSSKTFTFNMSSKVSGINSTVYSGGAWMPAKAVDGSSYMTWYDESGKSRRNLDYLTANRDKWNNGHNTVVDVRRSYTIIDGGYGVTLTLDGVVGQTLHF